MAVMAEMLANVNGLAQFAGVLIVVAVGFGALSGARDERRWSSVLAATFGLMIAASSRDLLWIYGGFQVFSLAVVSKPARALAVSAPMFLGLSWVALVARTSDLAALSASTGVFAGVLLFVFGLVAVWLVARAELSLFIAGSVAVVVVVARIHAWAPTIADELAGMSWLVAVTAILAGGIGVAMSSSVRSLVVWATIFTVGFAVVGLERGAPALPYVLMHLAASVVVLTLVSAGTSRVASWLLLLSLASVPPLPGFVTKLGLLASYSTGTMMLALFGTFLVGLGCARRLDGEASANESTWVTVATLAAVVTFGLFPQTLIEVATHAAATLF